MEITIFTDTKIIREFDEDKIEIHYSSTDETETEIAKIDSKLAELLMNHIQF